MLLSPTPPFLFTLVSSVPLVGYLVAHISFGDYWIVKFLDLGPRPPVCVAGTH